MIKSYFHSGALGADQQWTTNFLYYDFQVELGETMIYGGLYSQQDSDKAEKRN